MRWLKKYTQSFLLGFETALEYRANFLLSLVSAAYPIFIQTFLWTAIYNASSEGALYGYTFRQMIAYTFMAGLITRIVRSGFEYEIMDDVKSGKYSKFMVQPVGYFAYRLASFFGNKLPGQLMILGILVLLLAGLSVFWGLTFQLASVLAFLVSLLLAVMLNFLIFYCVSAISFWIVEVGFLFEAIRIVTVLLSGGIFPLEVFGERFVQVMTILPFKYTVNYPINVLTGKITGAEFYQGLGIQCLWIGLAYLIANLLWRVGNRRYVAVGG